MKTQDVYHKLQSHANDAATAGNEPLAADLNLIWCWLNTVKMQKPTSSFKSLIG
jgi:hypothetical protein